MHTTPNPTYWCLLNAASIICHDFLTKYLSSSKFQVRKLGQLSEIRQKLQKLFFFLRFVIVTRLRAKK